jgi:hypothetical protein
MTDLQPDAAADAAAAAEPTEPASPDPAPAAGPAAEPAAAPATPVGPSFRVMEVEDVALDLPAQYPSVTLIETEPPMRSLVFPVGLPEGTAMSQALRRIPGRRPMTHELFMEVLQRAHIDVVSVRLTGREEGNLLAELDLMTPAGRELIDCRPSDGLVLALRMLVPAPVLVDERLLEDSGDVLPAAGP